jgi:ferredoxin
VEAAPDRWAMSKKDGRCTLVGASEKKGFYTVLVHEDELERNREAAQNCPVHIIDLRVV